MEVWIEAVCQAIANASGEGFAPARNAGVGGGSISQGFRLTGTDGRRFFVKKNDARRRAMFEAEAAGLEELARCEALRIPQVITLVDHGDACFLVLEYLREHRLAFQRRLARGNGAGKALLDTVARLETDLEALLGDHRPRPSLLHGDLWSGNWGFLNDGAPTLFDPAVYYGDREADIAMMELFGHPGREFFAAYTEVQPLDAGYPVRRELYNLYHILNHFNLFGGGYASQAERMARRLLSELH
ncbi:MAG: fructosamine kinase family protein [Thioalkalivibrio sp.]|nr:fructosamine kinase family protein [Thioalkalivibrio sp.]